MATRTIATLTENTIAKQKQWVGGLISRRPWALQRVGDVWRRSANECAHVGDLVPLLDRDDLGLLADPAVPLREAPGRGHHGVPDPGLHLVSTAQGKQRRFPSPLQ